MEFRRFRCVVRYAGICRLDIIRAEMSSGSSLTGGRYCPAAKATIEKNQMESDTAMPIKAPTTHHQRRTMMDVTSWQSMTRNISIVPIVAIPIKAFLSVMQAKTPTKQSPMHSAIDKAHRRENFVSLVLVDSFMF